MTSIVANGRDSVLVLGDEDDVSGFGLTGVRGRVCRSERDLHRALLAIDESSPRPLVVLVSRDVAMLDPDVIEARGNRASGPIVLVLP